MDPDGSDDGARDSGQNQQRVAGLMQRSVKQHFPKPPAELDMNLQLHLYELQTAVSTELVRLTPLFKSKGMMGCFLDCCHRQTIDHLHGLLLNISTSQNCFVLMKWLLHTYLRYLSAFLTSFTSFSHSQSRFTAY